MEYKTIIVIGIFLILSTVFFAYYALVYTGWSVSGYVLDYSGKPVQEVDVLFQHHEETFATKTDVNGYYIIKNNLLEGMEDGLYHVSVQRKNTFTTDVYVGYQEDGFDIPEKKNVVKNIRWMNENINSVMEDIKEGFRITFENLRPAEHPSDIDPRKRNYTEAVPVKDEIDLTGLEDFYIRLNDIKVGSIKSVSIDLMHGNEVIKEGFIVANCRTYSGYLRPEGYNTELKNNIGLDMVSNRLTSKEGVVRLWRKYSWDSEGSIFSDLIISPAEVYSQRVGKSETSYTTSNSVASKFDEARAPGGGGGAVPGFNGPLVDLGGLGDYKISIRKIPNEKICIYLLSPQNEIVERTICINDTSFWVDKGLRRPNMKYVYSDHTLLNTLGVAGGIGSVVSDDEVVLTKNDGEVVIGIDHLVDFPWCSNGGCSDVSIIPRVKLQAMYTECKKYEGDNIILDYEEKGKQCPAGYE